MIIQSIQSCFSWKIVSLLDPSKLILQNQACKFNPILLKLKIRSSSRSWQVDPVRLILANRSCKILSSFRTTVSILQKRSNVIIHVAIYNFWGLFLPNPSNQNWWRNFNNSIQEFHFSLNCIVHKNFTTDPVHLRTQWLSPVSFFGTKVFHKIYSSQRWKLKAQLLTTKWNFNFFRLHK